MITFNSLTDISPYLPDWEHILLVHGNPVMDLDIWTIAKQEDSPPHFGNLYQRAVLERIKTFTEKRFNAEVDFFINGKNTHLLVKAHWIRSIDDFYLALLDKENGETEET